MADRTNNLRLRLYLYNSIMKEEVNGVVNGRKYEMVESLVIASAFLCWNISFSFSFYVNV